MGNDEDADEKVDLNSEKSYKEKESMTTEQLVELRADLIYKLIQQKYKVQQIAETFGVPERKVDKTYNKKKDKLSMNAPKKISSHSSNER